MTDTVNGGTNRSALIEQVRKSFKQYADLEDKRAEINAGMNEIRARWKSQGLSVKGIKAGLSRAKLDAEMRERIAALNPRASARVANRLIEAVERKYWSPDEATLAALHAASDELEDRLEGVVAVAA